MKIRSLVFSLALSLVLLASAFGQINNGTAASPALMNQNAYYGQWQVHSLNAVTSGSNTMTLDNCYVHAGLGNRLFFPFATNVTVTVVDGANTETALAVTAVSQPSPGTLSTANPYNCSFTATFSNAHNAGVAIISADNGVAEAANDNGNAYGIYQGEQTYAGSCTGTATSSQTIFLYGLGGAGVAGTCTLTAVSGNPPIMTRSGTLKGLTITATHVGVSSSSGVVTVNKNGSATALTCTVGTTLGCSDTTHSVSFVAGDFITISFTTQASEVLAGVVGTVQAF